MLTSYYQAWPDAMNYFDYRIIELVTRWRNISTSRHCSLRPPRLTILHTGFDAGRLAHDGCATLHSTLESPTYASEKAGMPPISETFYYRMVSAHTTPMLPAGGDSADALVSEIAADACRHCADQSIFEPPNDTLLLTGELALIYRRYGATIMMSDATGSIRVIFAD
jgi:hypothetical protein